MIQISRFKSPIFRIDWVNAISLFDSICTISFTLTTLFLALYLHGSDFKLNFKTIFEKIEYFFNLLFLNKDSFVQNLNHYFS